MERIEFKHEAGPRTLEIYLGDNIELMRAYPDGHFDLAIVDPEYGIGASEMQMGKGKNKKWKKGKKWDQEPPGAEYFRELSRVAKLLIVWGGNYFTDHLPVSKSWIFWDKGINGSTTFADGELAWCSPAFGRVLRKAPITYNGFLGSEGDKRHPTQKPAKLYRWVLNEYAKPGMLILDTNFGSGTLGIACFDLGFDLVAMEIDQEYYVDSIDAIREHIMYYSPADDQPVTADGQLKLI